VVADGGDDQARSLLRDEIEVITEGKRLQPWTRSPVR